MINPCHFNIYLSYKLILIHLCLTITSCHVITIIITFFDACIIIWHITKVTRGKLNMNSFFFSLLFMYSEHVFSPRLLYAASKRTFQTPGKPIIKGSLSLSLFSRSVAKIGIAKVQINIPLYRNNGTSRKNRKECHMGGYNILCHIFSILILYITATEKFWWML